MGEPDPGTPSETRRIRRTDHIVQPLAIVAIAVGVVALAGWFAESDYLASFGSGYYPSAPQEAVSFIVLGVALFFLTLDQGWANWFVGIAGGATCVFGGLHLAAYFGGMDLGFDPRCASSWALDRSPIAAGKMCVATALGLFLIGGALLLLSFRRRGRIVNGLVGCLAVAPPAIGLVFTLGYLHGAPLLYDGSGVPSPLPSMIGLLALGGGVLTFLGPDVLPLRPLYGSSVQAMLLRTFVPFTAITVCVVVIMTDVMDVAEGAVAPTFTAVLALLATLVASLICARIARNVGGRLERAQEQIRLEVEERRRAEADVRASYEKLKKTLDGTVHAMALTVEKRDPYTAGHQRRVSRLACAIAQEMGLSEEQIEGIRIGALLHDVGKISVPGRILLKPGRLTDEEFGIIKTHPQVGYEILREIDFGWPTAEMVLQHHERMNGTGYPSGSRGDDILLEARIIVVADVVEAISSHRPYRPALGTEAALREISENRGILYDADVVDACVQLFRSQKFELE